MDPIEQKMSMSLDDLIKSNKKNVKKTAKPASKKPIKSTRRPISVGSARNAASAKAKKTIVKSDKQAQKASDVSKVTNANRNKRLNKFAKARGIPQKNNNNRNNTNNNTKKNTTNKPFVPNVNVKVSFDAKSLNKTTDRVVTQQINAVLSRNNTKPNTNRNNNRNTNRK